MNTTPRSAVNEFKVSPGRVGRKVRRDACLRHGGSRRGQFLRQRPEGLSGG